MYEFTVINSYAAVHIMMQFLMTHGLKKYYLYLYIYIQLKKLKCARLIGPLILLRKTPPSPQNRPRARAHDPSSAAPTPPPTLVCLPCSDGAANPEKEKTRIVHLAFCTHAVILAPICVPPTTPRVGRSESPSTVTPKYARETCCCQMSIEM
jgi:hypothetical protein